jgi:1-acyl-sn-glycerol-3-phosphate acyltransferase
VARLNLTPAQRVSRVAIRLYARWLVFLRCRVDVVGAQHIPKSGPVLLAARHYHHVYDAAVLLATIPRELHFLVALDWAHSRGERRLLERACQLAAWPGLLRTDRLPTNPHPTTAIWRPHDIEAYARRSVAESVNLLAAGRAIVVFPEGSPVIDPERPARRPDAVLPFQQGFVTIARLAARRVGQPVPVVPVGLAYDGHEKAWRVQLQLGPPIMVDAQASRAETTRTVEAEVRSLSGL